jgi:hypothetical protein
MRFDGRTVAIDASAGQTAKALKSKPRPPYDLGSTITTPSEEKA